MELEMAALWYIIKALFLKNIYLIFGSNDLLNLLPVIHGAYILK